MTKHKHKKDSFMVDKKVALYKSDEMVEKNPPKLVNKTGSA